MLKTTFKVIDRIVSPTPDNSDDDAAKVEAVPEAIARSKLIAMRIVAERELSLFTPRQRERFVHDACAAVKDARRPIRLLAMTVICVLCERLPVVTLKKYKKSIIKSVFHPSVWNVRAVVRRCASEASERLCEALLDKFGRDDVKAAMPDRLFKLLEQRVLLKKPERRSQG
ncbi:Protein Y46E12BL.2 [Aphelenchoides avenae]|nr:Protein Y46E12BL.2 [Aphelenchus avenae]